MASANNATVWGARLVEIQVAFLFSRKFADKEFMSAFYFLFADTMYARNRYIFYVPVQIDCRPLCKIGFVLRNRIQISAFYFA